MNFLKVNHRRKLSNFLVNSTACVQGSESIRPAFLRLSPETAQFYQGIFFNFKMKIIFSGFIQIEPAPCLVLKKDEERI